MAEDIRIKVKEYSDMPGRQRQDERTNSGKHFLNTVLIPNVDKAKEKKQKKIVIDLDGTYGYTSSFLEEAFGGLARRYPGDNLLRMLDIVTFDEPSLKDRIKGYIRNAKKVAVAEPALVNEAEIGNKPVDVDIGNESSIEDGSTQGNYPLNGLASNDDSDEADIVDAKGLSTKWKNSSEIALAYAKGLVNLSAEQEESQARETVEKLKELSTKWENSSEIALAYANGLFNLTNKQEASRARETVEELKGLSTKGENCPEITLEYAKGLFNLTNKREESRASETVEELPNAKDSNEVIYMQQPANGTMEDIKSANSIDDSLRKIEESLRKIEESLRITESIANALKEVIENKESTFISQYIIRDIIRQLADTFRAGADAFRAGVDAFRVEAQFKDITEEFFKEITEARYNK